MANRVDIDIYANDKTGGTLNNIEGKFSDLEGGFQALTGISLTTAGVITAIGGGISAAVDYTKDAIEETVKYGDQVATLSRITGTSLEDTSRLIQVAQNMGIEYKDLATGLGNATKKGVDVSIENLLLLADEYKELETPIARAQWLTENFGAAGRDLEPIFAAATESIVADMEEVSDAMVWDAEKQESVDAYAAAIGEFDSAMGGLKITIATELLPTLTTFFTELNKIIGKFEEFDAKWRIFYASVTTMGGLTLWNADRKENFIVPELKFAEDLSTYEAYRNYVSEILELANLTADGYGAIRTRTGEAIDGVVILTEEEWNAQRAAEAIGDEIDDIPDASTKTINVDASFTGAAREAIGLLGGGRGGFNLGGGITQEARAVGGAVAPNVPYLVGENGPEIFKPNAAGSIIPNGQISDYSGGGEVDYDRMARAFIEALERSSLVR